MALLSSRWRAVLQAILEKYADEGVVPDEVQAGVLLPLSEGRRNRWWEVAGLLDLVTRLESGQQPLAKA